MPPAATWTLLSARPPLGRPLQPRELLSSPCVCFQEYGGTGKEFSLFFDFQEHHTWSLQPRWHLQVTGLAFFFFLNHSVDQKWTFLEPSPRYPAASYTFAERRGRGSQSAAEALFPVQAENAPASAHVRRTSSGYRGCAKTQHSLPRPGQDSAVRAQVPWPPKPLSSAPPGKGRHRPPIT